MSRYSIPALTMTNEFVSLDLVGRYVDDLVKRTGDNDYAVVYEWDDNGQEGWPPVAVLTRLDGRWSRREVLVTVMQKKDGSCYFDLALADVNGH